MIRRILQILLVVLGSKLHIQAQQNIILLPNKTEFNEGEEIQLNLKTLPENQKIFISSGKILGMSLDTAGKFYWKPDFNLVDRAEKSKLFQITLETASSAKAILELKINHVNQAPVIQDLLPFFIKFNTANNYTFNKAEVQDPDGDPTVFVPDLETFPQGMTMASNGDIHWQPSISQFNKLKDKSTFISFWVMDQPFKNQTKGQVKIEVTQMDLAPIITTIPKNDHIIAKENETINIKFYLSDPNGDEDIQLFDFISNQSIDSSSLKKVSNNEYDFSWKSNFDFVQDPMDTLGFYIEFYVLDRTQKKEIKHFDFTIKNTINEAEVDKKNYGLYEGTLSRAWELQQQLKEKEEELKKSYKKARKGKKQRSVVNASLGATTGLSSIMVNSPDRQRLISTVGGTTVLTIGTLEATEVIGRSMKDLVDRLNYVIEKKNEVQAKADIFARDYALKAARRSNNYIKSVDDLMGIMNLKGLVALELNASWESKAKVDAQKIKKAFKDFEPWQ